MTEEIKNDPKLIVNLEEVGPCKKKVTVEVPEETIKAILVGQYSDLQKEVVLPGFRKGRAPRRLLERRFGTEICEQTKLKVLADCTEQALKENEINALGDPDINHEALELPANGSFTYDFEVNVRPSLELPELEGIELEKPVAELPADFVDNQIKDMQNRWGNWETRAEGEAVAKDDQLVADIEITPEGEETVTVEGSEVFVRGEHGFAGKVPVEKIDELLIGAKVGDVKTTTTDVPEDFFNKEFKGKKCEVKISIKEIKFLKPAELNEEFCTKLGVETIDELKEKLTEYATSNIAAQANNQLAENVRKYLLENCNFDLPEDLVADQADSILKREYSRILMQGLEQEELKRRIEELQTSSKDSAKEMLKSLFIMDEIADKFKVEVTPEEINGYIAQTAAYQNRRPEKVREEMAKDGSLMQFSMQAREQKCIDMIIEKAKVTEVPAPKED